MGRGFGGQRLMIFPDEEMIAVFTGWKILGDEPGNAGFVERILGAVKAQACSAKGGGWLNLKKKGTATPNLRLPIAVLVKERTIQFGHVDRAPKVLPPSCPVAKRA